MVAVVAHQQAVGTVAARVSGVLLAVRQMLAGRAAADGRGPGCRGCRRRPQPQRRAPRGRGGDDPAGRPGGHADAALGGGAVGALGRGEGGGAPTRRVQLRAVRAPPRLVAALAALAATTRAE